MQFSFCQRFIAGAVFRRAGVGTTARFDFGNKRTAHLYPYSGKRAQKPALRRGFVDADGSGENDGKGFHAACLVKGSADGPAGAIPGNCRPSQSPGRPLESLRQFWILDFGFWIAPTATYDLLFLRIRGSSDASAGDLRFARWGLKFFSACTICYRPPVVGWALLSKLLPDQWTPTFAGVTRAVGWALLGKLLPDQWTPAFAGVARAVGWALLGKLLPDQWTPAFAGVTRAVGWALLSKRVEDQWTPRFRGGDACGRMGFIERAAAGPMDLRFRGGDTCGRMGFIEQAGGRSMDPRFRGGDAWGRMGFIEQAGGRSMDPRFRGGDAHCEMAFIQRPAAMLERRRLEIQGKTES